MSDVTAAPAFGNQVEWVNSNTPHNLDDNHGKIRLVFFFSFSNIQSLLLLPILRELENDYDDGLDVIGILCPRFSREHAAATVLKQINEHYVRFPVCVDHNYTVWQSYGVTGWPSCALIDVTGNLRAVIGGHDSFDDLHAIIGKLLDEAARDDSRRYSPRLSTSIPEPPSFLKFPSSVVANEQSVYIADSGHNRILELNHTGRVLRIFGSGNPGLWDGTMANCGFNKPQSLVLGPNALFVADTGSHAIRRIDLFNGEVNTIAGNGKASQSVVLARSDARDIPLNFPSGLALRETMLYFTMMAQHQVWQVDLKTGAMSWLAGSGQQSVTDGDSVTAAFSSPSSIAVAEEELFITDSEGSAIRSFELDSSVVTSRIGQGNFYFGNEDGGPRDGLLQRPMGLAYDRDKQELWIADTYNSCLRLLDTINWRLTTPAVDFELNHPTGVCVHDRTLWVANSNEHEILKIDLATHRSEPFEILETSA